MKRTSLIPIAATAAVLGGTFLTGYSLARADSPDITWTVTADGGSSSNSLDFGGQQVGVQSDYYLIDVANTDPDATQITFSYTFSDPQEFSGSDSCAGFIYYDHYCPVDIYFTPSTTGNHTSLLVMTTTDDNTGTQSTLTVSLSGMGTDAQTPVNTPVPPTTTPAPTNTPVPPTNTPVPPTNTPVPPTNTPVPPTSTPVPTNTPAPPTSTPIPSTNTPTPAPRITATPAPTETQPPLHVTVVPRHTPITPHRTPIVPAPRPAPLPLTVSLGASSVRSGSKLPISVTTRARARVTATLRILATHLGSAGATRKGRQAVQTVVLYRVAFMGVADGHGHVAGRLSIAYHVRRNAPALLTVTSRTAGQVGRRVLWITITPAEAPRHSAPPPPKAG